MRLYIRGAIITAILRNTLQGPGAHTLWQEQRFTFSGHPQHGWGSSLRREKQPLRYNTLHLAKLCNCPRAWKKGQKWLPFPLGAPSPSPSPSLSLPRAALPRPARCRWEAAGARLPDTPGAPRPTEIPAKPARPALKGAALRPQTRGWAFYTATPVPGCWPRQPAALLHPCGAHGRRLLTACKSPHPQWVPCTPQPFRGVYELVCTATPMPIAWHIVLVSS